MTEDLLSTREAAEALGVGTTSIKRWADSGLLPCVKTPGGHRRFPRRAVEALVGLAWPANGESPDRVARWTSWLTGRSPAPVLADALFAERHELGSWMAVAESMGAVLETIGRGWAAGEISVIEEHVASERLARSVIHCCETIPVPASAPRCFLIAAEGDDHTLGLNLLELCLREAGWRATWAGRKTPIHFACAFLEHAEHHQADPVDMVAVSASEHSHDRALLADQAQRLGEVCQRRGIPLVLGGLGQWPAEPPHGHRLKRFLDLVPIIESTSRASARDRSDD